MRGGVNVRVSDDATERTAESQSQLREGTS